MTWNASANGGCKSISADGRIFTRITRTEVVEVPDGADVTIDTDDAPVQKTSEPSQPSVVQLQLPDVLAAKLLQPASANEWEAVWEALEDGATYVFNNRAGNLELVEDEEEPSFDWRAADAGKKIRK